MTRAARIPPAPVGRQAPPTRAAAPAMRALRDAPVPPCRLRGRPPTRLTPDQNTEISNGTQRLVTHAQAKPLGIDRNR